MRIHFKIQRALYDAIHADLRRRHEFAEERLGFLLCRPALTETGGLIVAYEFLSTPDDMYVPDGKFGCVFNSEAMRRAMQAALSLNVSIFHVHVHEHFGEPWFSRTDLRESAEFVPNFWNVRPALPHGTLVFSLNRMAGLCWWPGHDHPQRFQKLSIIGSPIQITQEATWKAF
jgi:hypothetical protein